MFKISDKNAYICHRALYKYAAAIFTGALEFLFYSFKYFIPILFKNICIDIYCTLSLNHCIYYLITNLSHRLKNITRIIQTISKTVYL